jgi:hypothetical protein
LLIGGETVANQTIMNVAAFKKLLSEIGNQVSGDWQVWLSSDEEGNEYLPMFEDPELCLAVDKEAKRIIFYPSHR